jgi:hypothetical protein
MRAVHSLPRSIGEKNAALSEGFNIFWLPKNGLMMHHVLE